MQFLRQRKKAVWLVSFILYPILLLIVIRMTPLAGSSITELIDNSSYEMVTRPFHFTYCDKTLPVVLIFTVLYFIGFYIYISSMKNVRPGEEYGSASWTEPQSLTRKYRTRKGEEQLTGKEQRELIKDYKDTLRSMKKEVERNFFKNVKNHIENAGSLPMKLKIPIRSLFLMEKEKIEDYKDRRISEIDSLIGMPAWRLDMILSRDVRIAIRTKTDNINTLIIGGSGRGKTRGYIIPNIMQMNSSFVCTDPKGYLWIGQ